jgi:hypothetical protein
MTRWFGTSWGAPVCEVAEHVAAPVGDACAACLHGIGGADQGVIIPTLDSDHGQPWHLDCFMREIGVIPPEAGL